MYILFPGRHHLLTNFQYQYLFRLLKSGLAGEPDINGNPLDIKESISGIIFAITSANHSNTRRNPLHFHLRAMALADFAEELKVPYFVFGIDDVGHLADFADYTIKRIEHDADYQFDINPENTLVLCSTQVLEMYDKHGYRILPAELKAKENWLYKTELPWQIVKQIANHPTDWKKDETILEKIHPASYRIWERYHIGKKVKMLFKDDIIGDDGDITETRDYNSYVRQMDEIALIKYQETAPYIRPGRIGDIGCAVGSWIKLVSQESKFRESDFYGIEVARHLYDICNQRKHNGEFESPYIFFAQKNAVTGLVFEKGTMHTIHTSSLTHEIESYGNREDLLKFIQNRIVELAPGGVWINRDVIGPDNKDKIVYMKCNKQDGSNADFDKKFSNPDELEKYLSGLSTYSRFLRFARDFRKKEGYKLSYQQETIEDEFYFKLSLADACEFMSKKDYVDNWQSEMHEKFCFWNFADWKKAVKDAGFKIDESSHAYTNQWIVKNRLLGKVELFQIQNNSLTSLAYPISHMLLISEKVV